jgi:hypothetical protein
MNTQQIVTILRRNRFSQPYFKGVYPADETKLFRTYPHCFIANVDPSGQPGTHWVAFYIPRSNCVEYFDSLGEWPSSSNYLRDFLEKNFSNIKLNKRKIQANYEDACGPYVIYFLINRCRGRPFDQILKTLYMNPFSATRVKLFLTKLLTE